MLGPERSTPCGVHRFDRAVPFLAPVLERAFGVLGIVEAVVASVLVTNVPSDHIGIVLVMLRHRPAELQCVLTEHRTGGTPVLARARLAHVTAVVLPQHLGMRLGQPHRRGCGRGSEIYGDAGLAELVDDSVEPAEIVHVLAGFDFRPGEDAHGYEVHSRLDHEAHVLVPDLLGPLVGIVVAAVPDTGPPALQRPRPTMFSTLVHCHCSFRSSLNLEINYLTGCPLHQTRRTVQVS